MAVTKGATKRQLRAFVVFATVLMVYTTSPLWSQKQVETSNSQISSRRLLSSEGPVWEQCGYEANNLPGLFILLYAFLVYLIFVGIAILCDDFFVPSLEVGSD